MSRTFVGLHNNCRFYLAPPYTAFGWFQQADGSKILNALNVDIVAKMYHPKARVRVAALRTPFLKKFKSREESNRSNDGTKSSSNYKSVL